MSRILRGASSTPATTPSAPQIQSQTQPPSRVIAGAVFDARAEAERIVAAAHGEAAAIVDAARAGAERAVDEARTAGRDAGRAEAAASLAEALAIRDRALAGSEQEVARVALAAAERLVGDALALDPARIANIVGDGLARARRARDVIVRVHPEDAPQVELLRTAIATRAGRPASFSVRPDAEITRGGCLVETDLGMIDARLETKLDALARALGL